MAEHDHGQPAPGQTAERRTEKTELHFLRTVEVDSDPASGLVCGKAPSIDAATSHQEPAQPRPDGVEK